VLCLNKTFLEIINAPGHTLSSFELLIQTVTFFLMITFCFTFVAFFISSFYGADFFAVFFGFESLIICYCLFVATSKVLEKHFDMYDVNDYNKSSFEGWIVSFLFFGLGFFLTFLIMFSSSNNPLMGLGAGVVFYFPVWVIFFNRKNIFNESSKILDEKNKNVFGYEPRHYWVLGTTCGFCLIGYGFFVLSSFLYRGTPPLVFCILLLLFSFIIVYLILRPDLMNNILPFEIRKKNGFYLYSILSIVICFILLAILTLLSAIIFGF
jgi:hypothetical protein